MNIFTRSCSRSNISTPDGGGRDNLHNAVYQLNFRTANRPKASNPLQENIKLGVLCVHIQLTGVLWLCGRLSSLNVSRTFFVRLSAEGGRRRKQLSIAISTLKISFHSHLLLSITTMVLTTTYQMLNLLTDSLQKFSETFLSM